jgi:hypothetical protein
LLGVAGSYSKIRPPLPRSIDPTPQPGGLWEYYLAYCEAGFLSGNIDVRQVVFAKTR